MDSLHIRIITPEGIVYEGDCASVSLRSELGALMVLPRHTDLLAALDYSRIVVKDTHQTEEHFVARRGTFHMNNQQNTLTVMVSACHLKKELNLVSAHEYLKIIEEKLAHGEELSSFSLEFMKGEKFLLEKQIKGESE